MIKVSIIIPVYNRERLIVETLESVSAQTWQNWECVVVDDGSGDGSVEAAQEFARRDDRFKVFARPENRKGGGNAARNFGFEQSTGDLVNWFDSDDLMTPDFIAQKVACFSSNPHADAVISKRMVFTGNPSNIVFRENRTKLTDNILEDFLLIDTTWFLPDVMWRKSYLKGKPLFNEELFSGQDRDFHIRMLMLGPQLALCDHYLTLCRSHPDNITTNINRRRPLKMSHLVAMDGIFAQLETQGKLTQKVKTFYFWRMVKYLPFVSTAGEHKLLLQTLRRLHVNSPKIIWQWIRFWVAKASFALTGKGYFLLR